MTRLVGAALLAALPALTGCKIISIKDNRESRERRSDNFDAQSHVARIWSPQIVPALDAAAIDASVVLGTSNANLDALGKAHGRRAGEGSPWTFVVRGEGTVAAIDRNSRQGSIRLAVPGANGNDVVLMIGPVVTESTVRDALPMFDFNDFADQVAYASVSRALTARALVGAAPAAAVLTPGSRVKYLGVTHAAQDDDRLRVVPVRLEALPN